MKPSANLNSVNNNFMDINEKIPSEDEWGDYSSDVDLLYAHKIFAGKRYDELHADFYRNVIERADELRFMPESLFKYYFKAFCLYVRNAHFPEFSDFDAISCFLNLIEEKILPSSKVVDALKDEVLASLDSIATYADKNKGGLDLEELSERAALVKSKLAG